MSDIYLKVKGRALQLEVSFNSDIVPTAPIFFRNTFCPSVGLAGAPSLPPGV